VNRLISIGELAELKAVSVDTIRRWEKEGKLESVRTDGGHRRYRAKRLIYRDITLTGRINDYPDLLQRLAHASG
jgi:excisionase family DNA binding protein